jgi:hypothetical protein
MHVFFTNSSDHPVANFGLKMAAWRAATTVKPKSVFVAKRWQTTIVNQRQKANLGKNSFTAVPTHRRRTFCSKKLCPNRRLSATSFCMYLNVIRAFVLTVLL